MSKANVPLIVMEGKKKQHLALKCAKMRELKNGIN